MAPQITWRNIDAPDFGQAGRLLEAGSRGIGDAFTGLQNLIGQQQNVDVANFENMRKRNTAELQSQLLGFKTPEEMAAAQAQFTPEALKSRFGAAYDQSAINQLAAERPGQLRQDLTSQIQLGNLQQQEAAEPFVQQFYSVLAQDPGKAAQFLEQNKSNLGDTRLLYGDLANKQQQLVENQFRRQQLAEMAADRAEARAERQGRINKQKLEETFAQRYMESRLNSPDADSAALATPLMKELGIDANTASRAIGNTDRLIGALGQPNAQEDAILSGTEATNQQDIKKASAENYQKLDDLLLKKNINPAILTSQKDKSVTDKDMSAYLNTLIGDSEDATQAFNAAKTIFPGITNQTMRVAAENALVEDWTGDYVFDEDTFKKTLQQYKETAGNADLRDAYQDARERIKIEEEANLKALNQWGRENRAKIAKSKILGGRTELSKYVAPDYTKFGEEFIGSLDERFKPK